MHFNKIKNNEKIRVNKNRGFTLIELVLVISVIGVLTLLAAPKFMNYTTNAQNTRFMATTKVLEDAANRYYITNNRFPRLSEEAYTKEQIESFTLEVYDLTGEIVELDPNGNYYDIDYVALDSYISPIEGKMKAHYILQNPVGKVYYTESLTPEGEDRADFNNGNPILGGTQEEGEGQPNGDGSDKDPDKPENGYIFDDKQYEDLDDIPDSPAEWFTWERIGGDKTWTITGFGDLAKDENGKYPNDIRIPSTYQGDAVTKVKNNAFAYQTLNFLILPDGITSIDAYAFTNNNLTFIDLPRNLKSVGVFAFAYNNLTSLHIPESISSVIQPTSFMYNGPNKKTTHMMAPFEGDWYVEGNEWYKRIILEDLFEYRPVKDGFEVIGYDKQYLHHMLKGVKPSKFNIPGLHKGRPVVSINKDAFAEQGLTSVGLPDSIKVIQDNAFHRNKLTSIELPSNIEVLGNDAFSRNYITKVIIPTTASKGVRPTAFRQNGPANSGGNLIAPYDGDWYLENDIWYKNVIKEDVDVLSYRTTGDGYSVQGFNNQYIHHVLKGAIPQSVTIPSTINGVKVIAIAPEAFKSVGLKSVNISETIQHIGRNAFSHNKLLSVSLPSSIKTIDAFAFASNYLTKITIPESVTKVNWTIVQKNGPNQDSGNMLANKQSIGEWTIIGKEWVKE